MRSARATSSLLRRGAAALCDGSRAADRSALLPQGACLPACVAPNGAMPSIQIKDVPESAHAVLRQRAAAAHQSLQEYLRSRLIAEAGQPTLDEVLDRAGARSGGSVPMAAAARVLRGDRARR